MEALPYGYDEEKTDRFLYLSGSESHLNQSFQNSVRTGIEKLRSMKTTKPPREFFFSMKMRRDC